MKLKSAIFFVTTIVLTIIGYFFSLYGAVEFEYTGEINIFLVLGITLTFPIWLFGSFISLFSENYDISFILFCTIQIFGYYSCMKVINFIYEYIKDKFE